MYCTTNPQQIEEALKTARRVIATKPDVSDTLADPFVAPALKQAICDAISSAEATIRMYGDLLDENDCVAEYHDVA